MALGPIKSFALPVADTEAGAIATIPARDAQLLGMLDAHGRGLAAQMAATSQRFDALFRDVCAQHSLDPSAVAIDFDTGAIYSVKVN